jgi:hypothetical protein
VAKGIFYGPWHLAHRVNGIPRRVFGLSIQVLDAAFGLLHLAMGLCLGVASGASNTFFDFSG